MDAKKYAEAEKVYRFLAGTGKDPDSIRIIADIMVQSGRKAEALQMFKDMYAKKKTGDMANNIGILLAQESKTNPAVIPEAVNYLLEASLLLQNQGQAQKARNLAEGLFMSQDKEWNNRVKAIQESQKLIDDWTKTINTKFGDKSEDELTPDEKREYRKINEVMEKEKKIVEGIQAQQKATMARLETLLAQAKQRIGQVMLRDRPTLTRERGSGEGFPGRRKRRPGFQLFASRRSPPLNVVQNHPAHGPLRCPSNRHPSLRNDSLWDNPFADTFPESHQPLTTGGGAPGLRGDFFLSRFPIQ